MTGSIAKGVRTAAVLWIVTACVALAEPGTPRSTALRYHLESVSGEVLASEQSDSPINPASVAKLATTEWALDRLGPRHRFETRFRYTGHLDADRGRVEGDLVIVGGGDPDFHVENAYLVARSLNELGVREVSGNLRVVGPFWFGWEGGSEKRERDPHRRTTIMAERMRDALDPRRWSEGQREAIDELTARRGWSRGSPPSVVVHGEVLAGGNEPAGTDLVLHRSNPLVKLLKRFNAYSNNDIERLGASLGTADQLEHRLRRRWGASRNQVRLSTLSGLGLNRLTPRLVVRLLRDLEATCERSGIRLEDVLPVAGCDPGTLSNFPALEQGRLQGAVVAKTGSLNSTDGGVAVLAGRVATADGRQWFCVVSPRAAGRLSRARSEHQAWLLERVEKSGGPRAAACPEPLVYSDDAVEVTAASPGVTSRTP